MSEDECESPETLLAATGWAEVTPELLNRVHDRLSRMTEHEGR